MRKRVISFVIVLVIAFTGAFSCIASAAGDSIASKYFNFWKKYVQSIDSVWDVTSPGFYNFLVNYLTDQKSKSSDQPPDSGSHSVQIEFTNPDIDPLVYSFSKGLELFPGLDDCSYFAYVEEFTSKESYPSYGTTLAVVRFIAVPNQYADYVQYSFSDGRDYLRATQSIPFYDCRFDCGYSSGRQIPQYFERSTFDYHNSTNLYTSVYYANNHTGHPEIYDNPLGHSSKCYYTLFNDFVSSPLKFSADLIVTDDNILDITLYSSRPVLYDIDGLLACNAGILFDDGTDIMFAGSFYDYGTLGEYQQQWHFTYDLDDFAEYAYRKRCGIDNYVGFVSVMDQSATCLFAKELILNLDLPGVFDDVEDPPKWPDYKPDPAPDPDPPTFDTSIFNFSYSSNTYVTFNYQSIQNFSYTSGGGSGGGGSGGGGGSEGDDSSLIDDSSSIDDSSVGDSSLDDSGGGGGINVNPVIDFDFGLLTEFLNWFSGVFATLFNNLTGFISSFSVNFKLVLDSLLKFFNDFSAYITGYFNSWLEYFSQLIINFHTDFNNWCTAFSTYIGDCISNVGFNFQIVISNLKNYFDTQLIPDSDVVSFILSDCIGWYDQIQNLLAGKTYSASSFTINFPMFDYTYTFSDDNIASSVKTVARIIILACTALTCVRIGFQTFGINVGGGDNDS